MAPITTLRPIPQPQRELEAIEAHIKAVFRFLIYEPLMRELHLAPTKLENAFNPLFDAIESGRVTHHHGVFSGRFSAQITRQLKKLGAKWDKATKTFRLPLQELPYDIQQAVVLSLARFEKRLDRIDDRLAQILPEQIADHVHVSTMFDKAIFRVDEQFQKSVKAITISPTLTADQRERIARDWQNNMRLWIKDFTAKEITELRKKIQQNAFTGNRIDSIIKTIQQSYGVSMNKAKFLARQETALLVTKLKEVRYTEAGIPEYRWSCVAGSKNHPVRPSHKILDGKIFRWDAPPITTAPDEPPRRNNPGQDFNCRCSAIPVVRRKPPE